MQTRLVKLRTLDGNTQLGTRSGSDRCVKTVAALSLKEDKRYFGTVRGSAGSISANAVFLITMRVL